MNLPCKNCCRIENGSIIARSENGMRFELVNSQRRPIKVCKVDGCLIQSSGKKCDYLFIFRNTAILVELKGRDRSRALEQIVETAERLDSKSFSGDVNAYIVTSKVPRADTNYQTTLLRLRKRYGNAKCGLPVQKNLRISISI